MSKDKKSKSPETLSFLFSPLDESTGVSREPNPHIKQSTLIPEVVETLKDTFSEAVLQVSEYAGERTVLVERERIVEIVRYLKDELGFNYLSDLGGIDRFTEEDRYEVMYNLVNIPERKRIRLKIRVDESEMQVPSMVGVHMGANWNERECYDMFGIRFSGHPDMRRMFMPEDFEYYPLRKEFPLLGVPGSLPLPPQTPEAGLTMDPFAAAHGNRPVKSFEEEESEEEFD
jgi:NADH-quinone oxidoreductase subunit C